MNITIEELPESRIAYFRNIGEYGGKQNKELMESFKNWAQLNGLLDHSVILGIPQDHPNRTPKEKCRYDVCLVINQDHVPEPARIGTFSGGSTLSSCLTTQKRQSVDFGILFFLRSKKIIYQSENSPLSKGILYKR